MFSETTPLIPPSPALANLVWYGLELVVAHVEGHQAGQPADRRREAPTDKIGFFKDLFRENAYFLF